jgi:hypothetical protein
VQPDTEVTPDMVIEVDPARTDVVFELFVKPLNPLKTGEVNQDDFLMLPCTGGGEDCSRTFNLSLQDTTKPILVPVFCCEYSTAEAKVNSTDDDLATLARNDSGSPTDMECSINGNPLQPHYVETKPFKITVPNNHILDDKSAPAGTYTAVSAGFWHLLKPLPPGTYKVRFGGSNKEGFHTKVEYVLNVPKT